jgi:glycosyltransferase involved in cell wall biosynthesis
LIRPAISVVIAAYNCGPFITESLDSVLSQTYQADEIIVVDDGSTDDTAARVASYGSAVSFLRQANQGAAAARNAGLRVATGDFIAVLDADDVCHPERLERQVTLLAETSAIASFTGHWVFNETGMTGQFGTNSVAAEATAMEHLAEVLVLHATLMFDRRRAADLNYPALDVAEDVVFAAMLRTRGAFTLCNLPLYGYRRRHGQATQRYGFVDAFRRRLTWLETHHTTFWPDVTLYELQKAMWDGAARTLETFYWARDARQFVRLRDYLRANWPAALPQADALQLHWYPDWIWRAKTRLDQHRTGRK